VISRRLRGDSAAITRRLRGDRLRSDCAAIARRFRGDCALIVT
jgi:hypothetical protein